MQYKKVYTKESFELFRVQSSIRKLFVLFQIFAYVLEKRSSDLAANNSACHLGKTTNTKPAVHQRQESSRVLF